MGDIALGLVTRMPIGVALFVLAAIILIAGQRTARWYSFTALAVLVGTLTAWRVMGIPHWIPPRMVASHFVGNVLYTVIAVGFGLGAALLVRRHLTVSGLAMAVAVLVGGLGGGTIGAAAVLVLACALGRACP